MTFIREIPADKLTQEQIDYFEKQGYILKYMVDSVEIWAEN